MPRRAPTYAPARPLRWRGWAKAAEPLRCFLASPQGRTWPELIAWREGEGLTSFDLLNRLAWLEIKGLVVNTGEGARVRWAATGQAGQRYLDVPLAGRVGGERLPLARFEELGRAPGLGQ